MAKYLNVETVKRHGQRVGGSFPPDEQPKVPGKLVGILDNGAYEIAVSLRRPEQYSHFLEQYNKGMFLSMHLYYL